jgi:hypothetical protein
VCIRRSLLYVECLLFHLALEVGVVPIGDVILTKNGAAEKPVICGSIASRSVADYCQEASSYGCSTAPMTSPQSTAAIAVKNTVESHRGNRLPNRSRLLFSAPICSQCPIAATLSAQLSDEGLIRCRGVSSKRPASIAANYQFRYARVALEFATNA